MEQLTDLVLTLAASPWLYLVMFGFAAIDGFFPPIPSETVLVATGMPRRRFIPIAVVGAASWAGYCTLIGVVAGQWAHENPLLGAFIGVAIALVLGLCIDRSMVAFQKRTRRAEAPALATADAE
jgi:membrane protein DedA with SNARE-associated domain